MVSRTYILHSTDFDSLKAIRAPINMLHTIRVLVFACNDNVRLQEKGFSQNYSKFHL